MTAWRLQYQTFEFRDTIDFSEREPAMKFVDTNAASVISATVFAIDPNIKTAPFYRFDNGRWYIYGDEAITLHDQGI